MPQGRYGRWVRRRLRCKEGTFRSTRRLHHGPQRSPASAFTFSGCGGANRARRRRKSWAAIKAFWNYSLSPSLLVRVKPARTRPNHCALVLRKYTHHLERFAGRCRGVEALLMQKQQFQRVQPRTESRPGTAGRGRFYRPTTSLRLRPSNPCSQIDFLAPHH
jgi:hypothetical protein